MAGRQLLDTARQSVASQDVRAPRRQCALARRLPRGTHHRLRLPPLCLGTLPCARTHSAADLAITWLAWLLCVLLAGCDGVL
jgi:hypothetical protein